MTDPLELSIQEPEGGRMIEVDPGGLYVPSAEADVAPLWTTREELESGMRLIGLLRDDLLNEPDDVPPLAAAGRA